MYNIISLRDEPTLAKKAARWFNSKWGVPTEAYLECIENYISKDTELGWYVCLYEGKIVGGLGAIENDFHDRPDLTPNICAVYVERKLRRQGIAGKLLNFAVSDLKSKGITPVYLFTDLDGFYERYGWEFFVMAKNDGEETLSKLYIHR